MNFVHVNNQKHEVYYFSHWHGTASHLHEVESNSS